jgi:hypothetical protein
MIIAYLKCKFCNRREREREKMPAQRENKFYEPSLESQAAAAASDLIDFLSSSRSEREKEKREMIFGR